MMMKAKLVYWQTWCQTLPSPAIAWFAEPQAEERRECDPRSGSKASVTAASSTCRLKSAAAWGDAVPSLRAFLSLDSGLEFCQPLFNIAH